MDGKQKFLMVKGYIETHKDGNDGVTGISPESFDPDEWGYLCEDPFDELLIGLTLWGLSYDSQPLIDPDNLRVRFNLHPDIWDGSLEFDFSRSKSNWIMYQFDQGGAI